MKPKFNTIAENLLLEMAYGLGNYQPVTLEEFKQIIIDFDNSGKGAKPISFTSVTAPQYRKTGFPYKKLYKVGQTAGMIGFDYESNVNAQRDREGLATDFVKQQFSNIKERISQSVGITNTGLVCLIYRPLNPQPSYWVVEDNLGKLVEIDHEEAKKYLTPVTAPSSQGVEKTVSYRTYGFDKIISSSFEKSEYLISDANPLYKQIFDVVKDKLKS